MQPDLKLETLHRNEFNNILNDVFGMGVVLPFNRYAALQTTQPISGVTFAALDIELRDRRNTKEFPQKTLAL